MIGGVGAADDVGGQAALALEPRKGLERRGGQHAAKIPDHRLDHRSLEPSIIVRKPANTRRISAPGHVRRAIPHVVLGDGAARAMASPMKILPAASQPLLRCRPPRIAIVGGAPPAPEAIGRSVVTIVGSRGNFCTGSLIAPALVLTVAHCVQPGSDYKIVQYDADRKPQLQDVKRRRDPSRLQDAGDAGASRHRRRRAAAARRSGEGKNAGAARRAAASACARQRLHHRRRRRHHSRRRQERGRRSAPRASSRPASPARCRSAWSIRRGRARKRGSAPAPAIPARRCSRISRAGLRSSASSPGRPGRTAAPAAAA